MKENSWTYVSYASNPYLPGKEHVPDGEPHIFGDRIYVFGSHDLVGSDKYCAGSYVGWSASVDDPGHWKYEGEILKKGLDPLDPDGEAVYYAPDAVQGADGRYYLYYSIEGSMVISVAVCDTPAGNYKFYGHVKDKSGHVLGSADGDDYQFDPAVLADDDGRFYLYSGQGLPIPEINGRKVKGSMVCELEPDMITARTAQTSVTSNEVNKFSENPFFEASSIRKYDGIFYFIYSALPNTHTLCYATSDRPDGNFSYQGVLVSNADIIADNPERQHVMNYWGNNHGSILKLKNQYYIFYHRNTNKCAFASQGCIEPLVRTSDGRFLQAELTSTGFSPEKLPLQGEYAFYTNCLLTRKNMPEFIPFSFFEFTDGDPFIAEEEQTELAFVRNFCDGAMTGFRYLWAEGNESKMIIKARGNAEGVLYIFQNDEKVGKIVLSPSNDWSIYQGKFSVKPGKSEIRFIFEGTGSADLLTFKTE